MLSKKIKLRKEEERVDQKIKYIVFQVLRKIFRKIIPRHTIYGNKIYDFNTGNRIICEFLEKKEPCFIARIGSVEMQAINEIFNKKFGLRDKIPEITMETLYNNAGFFPKNVEKINEFYNIYCQAANYVDIEVLLMNRDEDYFFHNYSKPKYYLSLESLEPYYSINPWTKSLKGKRVLIISPFEKTIKDQYKKRKYLFFNKEILPEFEIKTLKSVQSIGANTEGYSSWFEALEYMKKKISEIDFDIAIIGCGAYSFPLGAYVKSIGKKSIIMGGATQILFGIKGARWDRHPVISKFYNEFWVRPDVKDKPKDAEKVEGGCYW